MKAAHATSLTANTGDQSDLYNNLKGQLLLVLLRKIDQQKTLAFSKAKDLGRSEVLPSNIHSCGEKSLGLTYDIFLILKNTSDLFARETFGTLYDRIGDSLECQDVTGL